MLTTQPSVAASVPDPGLHPYEVGTKVNSRRNNSPEFTRTRVLTGLSTRRPDVRYGNANSARTVCFIVCDEDMSQGWCHRC